MLKPFTAAWEETFYPFEADLGLELPSWPNYFLGAPSPNDLNMKDFILNRNNPQEMKKILKERRKLYILSLSFFFFFLLSAGKVLTEVTFRSLANILESINKKLTNPFFKLPLAILEQILRALAITIGIVLSPTFSYLKIKTAIHQHCPKRLSFWLTIISAILVFWIAMITASMLSVGLGAAISLLVSLPILFLSQITALFSIATAVYILGYKYDLYYSSAKPLKVLLNKGMSESINPFYDFDPMMVCPLTHKILGAPPRETAPIQVVKLKEAAGGYYLNKEAADILIENKKLSPNSFITDKNGTLQTVPLFQQELFDAEKGCPFTKILLSPDFQENLLQYWPGNVEALREMATINSFKEKVVRGINGGYYHQQALFVWMYCLLHSRRNTSARFFCYITRLPITLRDFKPVSQVPVVQSPNKIGSLSLEEALLATSKITSSYQFINTATESMNDKKTQNQTSLSATEYRENLLEGNQDSFSLLKKTTTQRQSFIQSQENALSKI